MNCVKYLDICNKNSTIQSMNYVKFSDFTLRCMHLVLEHIKSASLTEAECSKALEVCYKFIFIGTAFHEQVLKTKFHEFEEESNETA